MDMVMNLFANGKTGFYRIPGGAMVWLDGKMCPLKEGCMRSNRFKLLWLRFR